MDKQRIKYFVMDVDGTLTDGKIYFGESGEIFKAFNVKDGYAISTLLKEANIVSIIITGRNSAIVKVRAEELKINEVYQGVDDKYEQLKKCLTKYSGSVDKEMAHVAYIGDDLNDIPIMKAINAAGGKTGCPSDAVKEVKGLVDYICQNNGGNGAVREFADWILAK